MDGGQVLGFLAILFFICYIGVLVAYDAYDRERVDQGKKDFEDYLEKMRERFDAHMERDQKQFEEQLARERKQFEEQMDRLYGTSWRRSQKDPSDQG